MADKDLLEVIAEMLRKQDQHSELIAATNNGISETNSILKEFMGVSIKQWEEQQKFNERIFNKLDGIEKQLEKQNVFIVDKKLNLRGRKGKSVKGDEEYKEGYNTTLVSELHNEMTDDVKVILAEYRLALKRNKNASRKI